ncbi:ABC-2 type transport system permease protein [Tumebacillus sp. BK434]|uniref:ABC transporter permease n=1 Tax=Tumebacillus sp. BK434 TaxID=2512169 RepID=UPI0010482D5D|nr:ABC transporter permease [Tumebacillus sp. BK434]TCP58307.1 ABC-2 type transport system permease protein [Tumebacillus sp. BK434]
MRIWALTKRLMKQVIRDRRSVAMLFLAPLFVLWLLSIVLTTSTTQSDLDAVDLPGVLVEQLKQTDASVTEVSLADAEMRLQNGESDGYLTLEEGHVRVVLEGSDPAVNGAVQQAVQEAMKGLADGKSTGAGASGVTNVPGTPSTSGAGVPMGMEVEFLHGGKSLTKLDYLAPVLIGFFIFFFVFLISGVSFLRERTGGTLERVLATPIKRYEIVLGYFFGFGVFAVLQTALVQWFALNVLGVQSVGSFGSVLVINILLATVALSLGTLLSAYARNEFQMVQFIPLVVVPQIFMSGLFDLRNMPDWLMTLSQALPLTHAAEALRGVMIRGEGLSDIQVALWVLAGYCLLFLTLNILALRRYRKV